ncbi:MAG: cellulase family glycosylhydrolase [Fibrobacter sp.]|nr:cellulase family glycosylhydrolase [Fibrobacter sp.]
MLFKKIFPVATAGIFALGLTACGDSESAASPNNETPEVTPADSIPVPADSIPDTSKQVTPVDTTPAVVIPPTTGVGLLVDDLEDGDGGTLIGTGWYTYADVDNGGASVITTPTVSDEGYPLPAPADNGTANAFKVIYTLDKGDYAYDPYVGWGVQVPDTIDCSRFGGFSYWYKGAAHIARIETSDVMDYDVHMIKVKASKNAWTKVEIRFKDMAQEGWGEEVEFVAAHITAISFQAKGSTKVTTDSVTIDNLYLMDSSEVAKDTADMKIMDPVIPTVTIGDVAIANPLQEKAMKYLNKGINITNWLEEDKTKFNGTFKFDEKDVKLMADNGIKSLRFPIDLDRYATNRDEFVADTTGTVELKFDDENLFGVLDSFVEWTGRNNMAFVIDYHEYDNSYNSTSAKNAGYTKMMANVWKHVAAHYASNEREDIFYELLNEPDMSKGAVSSTLWRKAAQEDIDSIRTVDTKHTVIFGDAKWYDISLLAKGQPLADDNVVYAVHTYDPFVFTHQSASWAETKTIKNLMFPYDKEKWSEFSSDFGVTKNTVSWVKTAVKDYYKNGNKEAILKIVLPAKEWAVKNNVPVIINEFGAYNLKTDKQSVLNYMTAMREISDTLQIPLTHWGYTGGFALFESEGTSPKGTKLIEGMKEAYGLE